VYIVGTSGHIDHGKTSLIMALSGTDCDRLPEEKERAMTIDIGFASIEYPRFGTVSIVDVPGHERFIRNMVVGAWGIDLALLVVAVDDGWMPQTEDHFRVLQLLGVERLIVVLNKVDLADEEMIEFVEEEVREKISGTRFNESEIVKVSSKTMNGIEELREAIVVNLRKLSKVADAKKPYLFIDRIFASKGYGTVITGTLKNGIFQEDETVGILPYAREARIKRIESHFSTQHQGNPSQRTALNLSGVSVDDLKRGHVVFKDNFFTMSNDMIVRVEILDEKREIKNNLGIELLLGTSSIKGKMILIEEREEDSRTFPARIKLDKKWFSYPGEPFVLTSPGGYRIIGGGTVLLPEYDSKRQKRIVKSSLPIIKNCLKEEIIEFIITVSRCMGRDVLFSMFPESQKALERIIARLIEEKSVMEMDEFILTVDFHESSIAALAEAINSNVGLNLKETADLAGLDTDIVKILMPSVLKSHTIIEKDGRYFAGDSITEDTLSEEKKSILKELLESGLGGIEIDKMKNDLQKKHLKDLIKLDFAVSLDGNIIYHRDIYNDCRDRVMALFESLDKITVPEAKDAVGLSRKYILPLLNRIESDGLIKRLGDFRIKV